MKPERLAIYDTLTIDRSSHATFDEGHCGLELVAWLAGEPHGDHPECACPVVGAFVRSWNDSLEDADRERLLRPVIPRLVGSRSTPEVHERRSYLALDWLIRVNTTEWLALRDELKEHAATLRGLSPLLSVQAVRDAAPKVLAARDAGDAGAAGAAWAAGAALKSTSEKLQASALELIDAMLAVEED